MMKIISKDFFGNMAITIVVMFCFYMLCFGAFKLRYWNADEVLFYDLKEISINNNNRSFKDTISVVGSFVNYNQRYFNAIAGNKVDFDDAFENIDNYIGDFVEFNGVFIEHLNKDVYNKFTVDKCLFITNHGMEVYAYIIRRNNEEVLPDVKSYCMLRGTIIGKTNDNDKNVIEFIGRIP